MISNCTLNTSWTPSSAYFNRLSMCTYSSTILWFVSIRFLILRQTSISTRKNQINKIFLITLFLQWWIFDSNEKFGKISRISRSITTVETDKIHVPVSDICLLLRAIQFYCTSAINNGTLVTTIYLISYNNLRWKIVVNSHYDNSLIHTWLPLFPNGNYKILLRKFALILHGIIFSSQYSWLVTYSIT